MPTFSLMDNMHVRKNPWADTGYGKGEFYLASDPSGGVSEAQARQQEAFAEAASQSYSECNSLDGTSRNACRARKISNQLG